MKQEVLSYLNFIIIVNKLKTLEMCKQLDGMLLYYFLLIVMLQMQLIQTIVDELRGSGNCPSTGVSGARTNWVMEQIIPIV